MNHWWVEALVATIFFLISLISLLYATFTDLKERIVSDKLTYSLIGGGFLLQFIIGILNNSLTDFFTATLAMIATFIAAYGLWRIGVWAGGDVKLFTALAILNPVNYGAIRDLIGLKDPVFASISLPFFPLTLFIFSVFSVIPLAIFITAKEIMKQKKIRKKLAEKTKKDFLGILSSTLLVIGAIQLGTFLNIDSIIIIPALAAIGFLGKKIIPLIAAIFFAAGIILTQTIPTEQFALTFLALFLLYFFIRLYLIAKTDILIEKTRISELQEGMISAQTIIKEKSGIKIIEPVSIKTVINLVRNNNVKELAADLMKPKGTILASPANAGGVTIEQIKELQKAVKSGQLEDSLRIKKSLPFVPSVLIAYIITQVIGDFLWNLVL